MNMMEYKNNYSVQKFELKKLLFNNTTSLN